MSSTDTSDLTHSNTDGKHLGLALAVISCAQLMIVLDATVVNVAIPTIHQALHFSQANLEWLITAYSLTFGGLLLFGGRTGDLYGKRRMFMIGIALFATASLLGGFATNDVWLIITRGLQGIGGAIAAPTALSLIATNFPEGPGRNRAMGVYAAMSGGGGAVGLLLGGVLTDYVSWRWIFFINVPIAIVVLILAPRALNESRDDLGPPRRAGGDHGDRWDAGPRLRPLERLESQLGEYRHTGVARSGGRTALRVWIRRVAQHRTPHAPVDFQEPESLGELRDHALHRHRAVFDVLLLDPVPPEHPRLERDPHRRRLLADDGGHHRRGGGDLTRRVAHRDSSPPARWSGRRGRGHALDHAHHRDEQRTSTSLDHWSSSRSASDSPSCPSR